MGVTLDGVVHAVAWVAVAFSPVLLVGLVISWVAQHRRPATTTGPDPAHGSADRLPSDSPLTIRPTDRR